MKYWVQYGKCVSTEGPSRRHTDDLIWGEVCVGMYGMGQDFFKHINGAFGGGGGYQIARSQNTK